MTHDKLTTLKTWMDELGFYVPSTVFQSFRGDHFEDRAEDGKDVMMMQSNGPWQVDYYDDDRAEVAAKTW